MKIIFITGWAISGLWKWVTTSSIWKLYQASGYKVGMVKMDPYIQIDAWTMSPYEHWEVFVTEDWGECDLDIWNYERFVWSQLSKDSNITTGKVYQNVITGERRWDYLWKTVQIIPHITNEINRLVMITAQQNDITLVEVWWTVWDIENAPFLEAIRSLKTKLWESNIACWIVAPVLQLSYSWEIKTKLVQNSVKELRKTWIIPDFIVCRSDNIIPSDIKEKIAHTCDVNIEGVIEAPNAQSVYQVPKIFYTQNLHTLLNSKLWLTKIQPKLTQWNTYVDNITTTQKSISIWIVWKYTQFEDTYKSITESLIHAGWSHNTKIKIVWIDAEELENTPVGIDWNRSLQNLFKNINWVIIPGGFWSRWTEGKIKAMKYIRENNIPFLWICLWLQIAVIEYAKNICNMPDASSLEFDEKCKNPVISIMSDQKSITEKWWTMRLGWYEAQLSKWSLVEKLYWTHTISERHRHRYEVNTEYHEILEKSWLTLSWKSPDWKLVEFIELNDHPFYVATQAHPEFKSSLENPHPLFLWHVQASIDNGSKLLIA